MAANGRAEAGNEVKCGMRTSFIELYLIQIWWSYFQTVFKRSRRRRSTRAIP